ncbi:uncharacterized protein LOC142984286 isoform X1 [Anticarsia gemmatalis]|uniref:uncharacterized protein LOC142984286 isoform X1 n=1 Tax=Anticarsia gemmatalis TaxID=129554 RepID=UPI003F774D4B
MAAATLFIICFALCSTYSCASNEDVSHETDINDVRLTSEHKPHVLEQANLRAVRSVGNSTAETKKIPSISMRAPKKSKKSKKSKLKSMSKINKRLEPLLKQFARKSNKDTVPTLRRQLFISKLVEKLMRRIVQNDGIDDKLTEPYKKSEALVKTAVDGIDTKDMETLVSAANMLYKKMSIQKLKIFMIINNSINIFNGGCGGGCGFCCG